MSLVFSPSGPEFQAENPIWECRSFFASFCADGLEFLDRRAVFTIWSFLFLGITSLIW